jgi:hypothetical protein
MGTSSAETVKEIEATRSRLDHDLQELQDRMPAPAVWTKRLVGVAAGGGAAGSAFWFLVRRMKKKRSRAKAKAEVQRVQAVVQVLPEQWAKTVSEAMEDGRWKTWAGLAGGLWVVLRLAELRQLRRMNRAMVTARTVA